MKKFFRNVNNLIVGAIFVLVTFALSFIWWMFDPNTPVPLWVLSIVIIVFFLITLIIGAAFATKKEESSVYRLPKIKSIQKSKDKCVLIVERNDLFSQGSYATISYQEDEESLEVLLGLGYVESINSANNLQIEILPLPNPAAEKIYKGIKDNKTYKDSIKVKPSLHKDIFEGVQLDA